MKKAATLLVALLGLSFLSAFIPAASSLSTTEVISGASSDLDYVYIDGEDTQDVTLAASKNDKVTFPLFGDQTADSQYLYLGSQSPFDRVFFITDGDAKYTDSKNASLTWQYNDGDSWRDLDVNDSTVDNFTAIGTHSVSFTRPSSWDKFDFEDTDAYWIRVSNDEETTKGATIEQISADVFNVEVTVTTDNGGTIDNLTADNFNLGIGTDTRIYSFENEGDGVYDLAIQTEMTSVDYMLAVSVTGYLDQGFKVNDVDTNMQSYLIQLSPDTGCQTPFVDIGFHWSKTAITDLYCRGIIDGEDSNNYMVNHTVTRAEFLKMAIMNAAIDTSRYDSLDVPFGDVNSDDWFYKYVSSAYTLGAIDDGSYYYPDGNITRVEALTLLTRLAGVDTDLTSTKYTDVSSRDWYASAIRIATDDGVVEGYPDNTFRPASSLTRAEAAVMVNNAYRAWVQDN